MTANVDLASIREDAPLRLTFAARLAFPDGSMSASGLRREMEKGRLEVEKIAGRLYTTLAAIRRMRELCRVEVEQRRKPDLSVRPAAANADAALSRLLSSAQELREATRQRRAEERASRASDRSRSRH